MDLNKEQTIKATELLGLLCESGHLNSVMAASFFGADNDKSIIICKKLKEKGLLNFSLAHGDKINGIDKKELTCHAFKDDTLMKEFIAREGLVETATIDLKIKQIELFKQYWWVAGIILAIIGWILYAI